MAQFLSSKWLDQARAIRAEYRGRAGAPPHVVKMNLNITDCPAGVGSGGVVEAHMDSTGGEMEMDMGHLDEPQLTVTMPYDTAKAILVDGNPQAGMQAFMSGQIQVVGDMTKLMAVQSGEVDPVQAEIAARMKAMTDGADETPAAPPRRYLPSAAGPLRDDDVAHALRLADLFGAWLHSLPDEEPRVPRAEATLRTLTGEMRLLDPDRVIVRRCSQIMIELISDELEALTADLARQIENASASTLLGEDLSFVASSITSAAQRGDVIDWQEASDDLTDVVDEIEKAADVPPPVGPDPASAPGRGTRLRNAALYMGGGLAAGVMSAAGKALYGGMTSVLPNLIEQLLNVVGW